MMMQSYWQHSLRKHSLLASRIRKLRILPVILLRRFGLAPYLNYQAKCKVGTQSIAVPMHEGKLESVLLMEEGYKAVLLSLLKKYADITCFVDIGANCGQTMLEVCSWNREIIYYGFEPNPEAFGLLQKVSACNKFNSTLFPWACGDASKPLKIYRTSELDAGATVVPEIRPDTYASVSGFWIATYPLDKVAIPDLPSGFILKIDVEGSELEVLRGALTTIHAKRPIILCEVLHAHRESEIPANDARKRKLESILDQLNYTLYLCVLDLDTRVSLLEIQAVSEFPKNQVWSRSPHTCDYIFAPKEIQDFAKITLESTGVASI